MADPVVDPNIVAPPAAITPPAADIAPSLPVETPVVEAPTHAPTLLETTLTPGAEAPAKVEEPKPEEKPAETVAPEGEKSPVEEPKPEGDKPTDDKPLLAEAVAPTEWKIEVPETLKVDEPKLKEFTSILDSIIAPKEGETRDQLATRLMNMASDTIRDTAEQAAKAQWDVFNKTQDEWKTAVLADPVLGGAGHKTAMGAIARVRDYAVPPERRAAFDEALRITGAGNNPEILRAFHTLSRYIDEPGAPPPNPKPAPQKTPSSRLRDNLYDHPTSVNAGR